MKTFSFLVASSLILEILYSTQAEILTESAACQDIECSQGKHYQLELITSLINEENAKNAVATANEGEHNEH